MVTLEDYHRLKTEKGFEEFPSIISDPMKKLDDFLAFKDLDLDTRIYLCSMLIRRSIGVDGGIYMPYDVDWFMGNFITEYEFEPTEFFRQPAFLRGLQLILEKDEPSQIVGTTYMYTVIEFLLKHRLGFRIFEELSVNNKQLTAIGIGDAYQRVKKGNYRVSREFHTIDKHFERRAVEIGTFGPDLQYALLRKRISHMRNLNLHGRNQFMTSEGVLLGLVFALLYYCEWHELQIKAEDEEKQNL